MQSDASFGLISIHYNQPEGVASEAERYRVWQTSKGDASRQSARLRRVPLLNRRYLSK